MNAMQPFAFDDQLVRAIKVEGEPWFVGADVAHALGHRDATNALRSLDDDEKGTQIVSTLGGDQIMIVISEPGVFRLIFTSRKAEAERFKRWLAHEVLPALRRDGFYGQKPAVPEFPARDEEIIFGLRASTLNAAARFISMVNAIYGPEAARAAYEAEPRLPAVRAIGAMVDTSQDDPYGCVHHLFRSVADKTQTVRDVLTLALSDKPAARGLRKYGLALDAGNNIGFLAIANRHGFLETIFEGTQWAGDWRYALMQLPGAKVMTGRLNFDGEQTGAVLIHRTELARLLNPN